MGSRYFQPLNWTMNLVMFQQKLLAFSSLMNARFAAYKADAIKNVAANAIMA